MRLEGEGLLISVQGVGTFVTDSEIDELERTYRLRMELAELTSILSPRVPDTAFMVEFRAMSVRSKALKDAPEPRAFAQLNKDFFLTLLKLTNTEPLREIDDTQAAALIHRAHISISYTRMRQGQLL